VDRALDDGASVIRDEQRDVLHRVGLGLDDPLSRGTRLCLVAERVDEVAVPLKSE